MRKALLFVVVLALSGSAAQAQGRDRDDDDDASWGDHREYRDERGRHREDDENWRGDRAGRFGRRAGGARFFIRSGETRLGVVCSAEESMRNCVDAALNLLSRARQAGSEAPPAPGGGSSAPSPRP
jgi:hypothetical protein